MKKERLKHLEGKEVYPIYRLDKNICWYNINTFILGIIYGFFALEWLRKGGRYYKRFTFLCGKGSIWLPPVYATPYYKYIYESNRELR